MKYFISLFILGFNFLLAQEFDYNTFENIDIGTRYNTSRQRYEKVFVAYDELNDDSTKSRKMVILCIDNKFAVLSFYFKEHLGNNIIGVMSYAKGDSGQNSRVAVKNRDFIAILPDGATSDGNLANSDLIRELISSSDTLEVRTTTALEEVVVMAFDLTHLRTAMQQYSCPLP